MAEIRSVEEIARKWASVTPMRSADYEAGVKNPKKDWAAATGAAETAYEEGVRGAIASKRFGKGVKKVGTVKWQAKAATKGTRNWGPGVAEAEGEFGMGFRPYQAAISKVKLSPRYAKRDPRNLKRVEDVVKALTAEKEAQLGKS